MAVLLFLMMNDKNAFVFHFVLFFRPVTRECPPTHPPVDDHNLAQIVEMGFSTEMGTNALIITRGNFEEALNLLISSPER